MPRVTLDDPDDTLSLLRESVAQFAAQHDGARILRHKRAGGGDLDKAVWTAMARAGWTGLLLPEALGGAGLGMREQAILSEALGRALIAEPVVSASVLSSILIADAPTSEECLRLADGIVSGRLIVTPAWQERAGMLNGLPVAATRETDGFVLNGTKQFVDAARSATDLLVTASSVDGSVLLSVPADAPGLSIADRPGIDGGAIATVWFTECFVPSTRLLASGERCDALLEQAQLRARLALAAELAGIASSALERTVAYTRDRVQFGKPIASFQSIQHRLVDMWMDAEFACAAVANAVVALTAGDGLAARLAVLAAKARAGDAAFSICRRAVHLHGAMGFTDECDIGLYLKRAINLNASLGQPEQLRLQFVDLERAA
jgi:alkylation response protein AidB-like acyl-CoA dehydrogenase